MKKVPPSIAVAACLLLTACGDNASNDNQTDGGSRVEERQYPELQEAPAVPTEPQQTDKPLTAKEKQFALSEIQCLAENIYFECRGCTAIEQIAVAKVTINRTQNPKYPETICKVVYQPGQFTWTATPMPIKDRASWESAVYLAWMVRDGQITYDPTAGATHYYAHGKIKRPRWAWNPQHETRMASHTYMSGVK